MTNLEFDMVFKGANGPDYRGAPYPEFNPYAINESEFSDAFRYKDYEINYSVDNEIDLFWKTQGTFEAEDVYPFLTEVSRCIHKEIGYTGVVNVEIVSRDGKDYGYYSTKLMPKNN